MLHSLGFWILYQMPLPVGLIALVMVAIWTSTNTEKLHLDVFQCEVMTMWFNENIEAKGLLNVKIVILFNVDICLCIKGQQNIHTTISYSPVRQLQYTYSYTYLYIHTIPT